MESVGQRGEVAIDGAPLALDARALLGIQHREGLGRPARPRVRCNEADQRPATDGKEPVPGWQSLGEGDVQIHREISAVNSDARNGTTAPVGIATKNGQSKSQNLAHGECYSSYITKPTYN